MILDLTVPGGMGGKETIKKLLEIDPKVKAIVSSGYATDPIMSKYREFGFSSVVVKPYTPRKMVEALTALLNKTSTRRRQKERVKTKKQPVLAEEALDNGRLGG